VWGNAPGGGEQGIGVAATCNKEANSVPVAFLGYLSGLSKTTEHGMTGELVSGGFDQVIKGGPPDPTILDILADAVPELLRVAGSSEIRP
jgi:hypothetical protein